MTKKKKWYDYLWIVSAAYLILGFFNILFAWMGLLCFFIPLLIAIFGGDKMYCNKFCGRGQLFDLLGKTGSREAIRAASNYLSTALYQVYRHLYHANPANNPDFFSVSQRHFMAGLADADLHMSEVELTDALAAHVKEKGRMPEMDHAALARDYPVLYQSMLQLIHNSGERINHLMEGRKGK